MQWYGPRSRSHELGDPVNPSLADVNIAEIYVDQGRFTDAEQLLIDAVAVCEAAGDASVVALAPGCSDSLPCAHNGSKKPTSISKSPVRVSNGSVRSTISPQPRSRSPSSSSTPTTRRSRPRSSSACSNAPSSFPIEDAAAHRLRAITLVHAAAIDDAREALTQACDLARETGNDYQLALALEQSAQLGGLDVCAADRAPHAEATEVFRRLESRLAIACLPPIIRAANSISRNLNPGSTLNLTK